MEICGLSLRVTQDELNSTLRGALEGHASVRGVKVLVVPAGVTLEGEKNVEFFGMKTWVPFEADLEIGADGGYLAVRVVDVRAIGRIPVKGLVLGELAKLRQEWLIPENDTLVLNLERLLETRGVVITLNLSAVRLEPGALVLEAQSPPARVPAAP